MTLVNLLCAMKVCLVDRDRAVCSVDRDRAVCSVDRGSCMFG